MKDLRHFLERVKKERPTDMIEIEHQVDGRFETTGILVKLEERQRSPVLHFKNVKGTDFPVVSNVCGSMGRIALALDCKLNEVSIRYADAIANTIKPLVVDHGPIHDRTWRGPEVDLRCLPPLIHHQNDADRPYITAAIGVASDPDTGHVNLSFHRLMVAGRDKTGILIEPGKHLDRIYQKYRKANKPMPIAFFIGAHPLWTLGAVYSGPLEEYDVIGGLLKEPLQLVECLTQPGLRVPAFAEIVLEGFVPPDESTDEGPFGEWPGFSTGVTKTPVFHVTAITARHDALFQDVVSGHAEHLILEMPAIEYRALKNAREVAPGVSAVALVAPLTSIVALKKNADDEPRKIMDTLLRSDIQAKHMIVVDDDVNISDLREVWRAIGLNTQASRDVHIYSDEQGTPLDPSARNARTAKMGIDATRKAHALKNVMPNRVPESVLASIDIAALLKR